MNGEQQRILQIIKVEQPPIYNTIISIPLEAGIHIINNYFKKDKQREKKRNQANYRKNKKNISKRRNTKIECKLCNKLISRGNINRHTNNKECKNRQELIKLIKGK